MLLVIHNLPSNSKYSDIKALIQSKCGLSEVILDNLMNEGLSKRVTVGLADDGDGAILVRKINGLFIAGKQLYVEDIKQKKESEQPYRSSKSLLAQSQAYDPFSSVYHHDAGPKNMGMQENNMMIENKDPMNMLINHNMAMGGTAGAYYNMTMPANVPIMAPVQNSYVGFGGQQQQQQQMEPLMPQNLEVPAQSDRFGFKAERIEDSRWDQRCQENRHQSPARGARFDSNWGERCPPRGSERRRSRSPRREKWDSYDQSDNRQQPVFRSNQYDNSAPEPPQRFGYPEPYASNSAASRPYYQEAATNIYGSHASQQPASEYDQPSSSNWDQPPNRQMYQNRRDENDSFQSRNLREDFQSQNSRRNISEPRGDRNFPAREDSKPYKPQNYNRGGFGPPQKFETEIKHPPKRPSRWNDSEVSQPQAKRFAPEVPKYKNFKTKVMSNRPQPKVGLKGPSNAPNAREQLPNNKPTDSLEKRINRDETWRGQAASTLAKTMLKVLQVDIPPSDKIFTHLKHSIRARINIMLGDKIDTPPEQIVAMYQTKFKPSEYQEFFTTVVNNLKQQSLAEEQGKESDLTDEVKAEPIKDEPSTKSAKPGSNIKTEKIKTENKPNVNVKTENNKQKTVKQTNIVNKTTNVVKKLNPPKRELQQPQGQNTSLLPRFPEGDKQSNKKAKAEEKIEWQQESYDLPPLEKKALDEEVDTLCDIFMGECMPGKESEKPICEQIADVVSDDFRKVVRIQISKRLLNKTKNLICRVHTHGKAPPRNSIEKFLIGYGCTALQKSDRKRQLCMAHFDSLQNYDKIVALGSAEIDGITMTFKPFQICGPPPSAKEAFKVHAERRKKFIQSQIDASTENILQPGYVYDPKADKEKNERNEEANETEDSKNMKHETVNQNVIASCEENWDDDAVEKETNDVIEKDDSEEDERQYNEDNTENVDDDDVVNIPDEENFGEGGDIPDENIDEDDLEDY